MLHDSHRAERVGEFVPMTMKDEGKRSAGTVRISMRWALAYEYEVLRGCATQRLRLFILNVVSPVLGSKAQSQLYTRISV